MKGNDFKHRFVVSAVFLVLAMSGLGVRLAFLHLGANKEIREDVALSRRWEKTINVRRGSIYDRNGEQNILAMDLPVKNICADPYVIVKNDHVFDTAVVLAETLDLPVDEIAVRLSQSNRRYVPVKRFLLKEEANNITTRNLAGVFSEDAVMRFYPQKSFMCHVLGFVNYEGAGSAGIEHGLDKYLKGCPGLIESDKNALRQELYTRRERYVAGVDGADVTLTIDQNIQYTVEKILDELMDVHKAKGAWAIVERVKTGEIIGMASRPSFDLNKFYEADENALLNRTIGSIYEPGSTFKMVTIAAALNEGIVTPETIVNCENGSWFYKGRVLRDYRPHGDLSIADTIKKSSNIGVAKVALMLGDKKLHEYASRFGVGEWTGIDLPGEERGILKSVSEWSGISSTRIAIGQGVAVTALQMISIVCAIANDGFMMKPYIVRAVSRNGDGSLMKSQPQVMTRPVSQETASTMRKLLGYVTEEGGTGKAAKVDGYSVGGKTGTAQKVVNGEYSSSAYMASFVGFLPVADPEIAIIVVVDEPQPFHTGGYVAAPAFGKIAEHTVRYLDIRPTGQNVAQK